MGIFSYKRRHWRVSAFLCHPVKFNSSRDHLNIAIAFRQLPPLKSPSLTTAFWFAHQERLVSRQPHRQCYWEQVHGEYSNLPCTPKRRYFPPWMKIIIHSSIAVSHEFSEPVEKNNIFLRFRNYRSLSVFVQPRLYPTHAVPWWLFIWVSSISPPLLQKRFFEENSISGPNSSITAEVFHTVQSRLLSTSSMFTLFTIYHLSTVHIRL